MAPEWWEEFFLSELWIAAQCGTWSEEETRSEAERVENLLELSAQARILDAPCGNGRLSLALAQRGHRVTGVDATLPLLERARRRSKELELDIVWEHRDMRDLPGEGEFDAVLCFWGSFGYFDEKGNADYLAAAARALAPGGRILVDTHVAETLFPIFQERGWHQVDDIMVIESRHWDHEKGRIDGEWTFLKEREEERRSSSLRIYTYRELARMLEEAGFDCCEGFASLDGESFRIGSPRLFITAAKAGKATS
jgi:SAM-dependent methyltransferase